MKLIDANHPFFAKPLTRWLTVLAPLVWAGVEFVQEEPWWGLAFAVAAAYAAWELLAKGPKSR